MIQELLKDIPPAAEFVAQLQKRLSQVGTHQHNIVRLREK